MTLHEKLIDIQQELKVPKNNKNNFGGYQYRNIEDIEERVKPLLKKHKLTLRFEDEIVAVGERVYVKATAILSDGENDINNPAYAREAESKKGMDDSQLTGSTSSYARKYAAGGLLLIDDTKDADSADNTKSTKIATKTTSKKVDELATDAQRLKVKNLLELKGVKDMSKYLEENYGFLPGKRMLKKDASNLIEELS